MAAIIIGIGLDGIFAVTHRFFEIKWEGTKPCSLSFYLKVLKRDKNINVTHDSNPDLEFQEGEIVATCMQNRTPEIEQKYDYEILYSHEGCKT